ncbi:MAG: hypothetical protein WCK91_02980 [bacterium]
METRNCLNCKKDFMIDERDVLYYQKINVPHPLRCPDCRMVRRVANSNAWSLFWRNCDKCQKRTLSIYPASQEIIVYCNNCWWSDSWDGTEYAMDYDPSKTFLSQVRELYLKTPHMALETEHLTLKNCDYSNAMAWCKNCVLTVWADYCENVTYSSILNTLKDSSDCVRMNDSELCYECIGQNKSYQVLFSQECDSCTDVWFSRNCYSCTNCVGCANLRGESYCIFNQKYSKEDYADKIKELRLDTRTGIENFKKEVEKFWLTLPYRSYTGNSFNVNTTGEYVYESKNSLDMYIASGAEDCRRCQFITVAPARDCVDYSGWGNNATLVYESGNVGANSSNVKFSSYCFPDTINLEYCIFCVSGKNDFGCVNLKRKQYSILNKVYEKEEYEKLVTQIRQDMVDNPYIDKLGQPYPYGEFFPSEFSVYAYNLSNAGKFFPKTRDQVESEGYYWHDEPESQPEATIDGADLPETLAEVSDTILNEVIACVTCPKKYKILALELEILKKLGLPLPSRCPKCREAERFSRINRPHFYERTCAKCSDPIITAFSQERPEVVYCPRCYQQEFV